MKKMAASKFKEQCLSVLDHLEPEGLVITKRGRPVARVTPLPSAPAQLIGSLEDRLVIDGDIMSTGVRWDAQS